LAAFYSAQYYISMLGGGVRQTTGLGQYEVRGCHASADGDTA
jgi:hypothetical protein